MNIAPASVMRTSASRGFKWNRMTKTRAGLRKLSLKAAKHWHQNRGAKRLDSIIGGGIPALLQSSRMPAQAKNRRPSGRLRLFPLIRVQGRAFFSKASTTIAPKARPREMLMTTQNSVSHMAYLLEPDCKRREVWRDKRVRPAGVPNFFWRAGWRGKLRG